MTGAGGEWGEGRGMHGGRAGGMVDWKVRVGWRIRASREHAPSVIIGYKIYMDGEREAQCAVWRREARCEDWWREAQCEVLKFRSG